jgi:phosphotransferase system HPr (HPr) family protein
MVERQVQIVNRLGLHARAAAKLVHVAARFGCDVSLIHDGDEVDAKSILGILQLGACQGTELAVACDGQDEAEAVQAITELIADRFGEES